ncbi:MAG: hypothetical protein R2881_09290 [Eubacteriales bacterium]
MELEVGGDLLLHVPYKLFGMVMIGISTAFAAAFHPVYLAASGAKERSI